MVSVTLDAHAFGLVIRHQTGIQYSAQTAGSCRNHPKVEGFFVPLTRQENPGDHSPFYNEFHSILCGILAGPNSKNGNPTVEIANTVDGVLRKYKYPFRIERKMLDELQEGWMPVIIDGEIAPPFEHLMQLFAMRAVLIYPNCC